MNTKHTPGPWHVSELDAFGNVSDYHIFIEPSIAVIERKVDGHNHNDLNDARLIAAAPDLLEALQSAHQWMDDQADAQSKGGHATFDLMMLREQRDRARAAIAKATGATT